MEVTTKKATGNGAGILDKAKKATTGSIVTGKQIGRAHV